MVFLHAMEHGATPPRVSTDLDVLVNVRVVAGGVREFVAGLESRSFELAGISPEGIAHRYERRGVSIDVLAPEGLGPRSDLTTTPPGRTLQVPGGTQALERTEFVPVAFGDQSGMVPRPSLLGAVISKAVAVEVDDVPEAQRHGPCASAESCGRPDQSCWRTDEERPTTTPRSRGVGRTRPAGVEQPLD